MRSVLISALLVFGILAAPASALAVAPLHSIQVYGESGSVIATFTSAKCKHKKGSEGPYFNATAISTDGNSKLFVSIGEFAGFKKEYEIELGSPYPKPFVVFEELGADTNHPYASYYIPPFESPGFGEILFREAGHLMGTGYGPAMYDFHAEHAVFLTGVVECDYGKKGKTGGGGKNGKPGKKPGKA